MRWSAVGHGITALVYALIGAVLGFAQAVMEGFLEIRLPPGCAVSSPVSFAIVPAAVVTIWYGESGTARLLILTQVVLSLQLSFAVIPLIKFTASRAKMGDLVAPKWLIAFAGLIAAVIVALNLKLLVDVALG